MKTPFTGWVTPSELFGPIQTAVGEFAVDAAADETNNLVPLFYGPGGFHEDALAVAQWHSPAWCNPPYGKGLGGWLDKFIEQAGLGVSIVALLPAYTEDRWWYEKVVNVKADILFLVGRVPFLRVCSSCNGKVREGVQAAVDKVEVPPECENCGWSGFDPKPTRPRHASAIVIYGPTAQGNVGWLDWRKNKDDLKTSI